MEKGKSRDILIQILEDMDDFSNMKNLKYPPVYLLGGSGCIVAGYMDRATTDFDLLDMDYDASMGRLLRILDRYDLLDFYLTTIPEDFRLRVLKIEGLQNVYVLSREDLILSKVGRYSERDIEDIAELMRDADKKLLSRLAVSVLDRTDISERVREAFTANLKLFRERFDV